MMEKQKDKTNYGKLLLLTFGGIVLLLLILLLLFGPILYKGYKVGYAYAGIGNALKCSCTCESITKDTLSSEDKAVFATKEEFEYGFTLKNCTYTDLVTQLDSIQVQLQKREACAAKQIRLDFVQADTLVDRVFFQNCKAKIN